MQYSLPEKYRKNTKTILMEVDYIRIYLNFDTVFLLSTLISFAILWFNLKTRHHKYSSYANKDD
jgi:putative effector of murein hydrolase